MFWVPERALTFEVASSLLVVIYPKILQLETEVKPGFLLLQEAAHNFALQLWHMMIHVLCHFCVSVDGQLKCEKWIRDDDNKSEESKMKWWVKRLIGRPKDVHISWPYPFAEGKLFVMTLTAGLEGYHVNVDGRHVASFPYRTVSYLKPRKA